MFHLLIKNQYNIKFKLLIINKIYKMCFNFSILVKTNLSKLYLSNFKFIKYTNIKESLIKI